MNVRRLFRCVAMLALVGAMVLPLAPAHAVSTPTAFDKAGDIIDVSKHPQNSFRPGQLSPYSQYQYSCPDQNPSVGGCQNIFDVREVQATTNPLNQSITFRMKVGHTLPARGAPLSFLPVVQNPAGPNLPGIPFSDGGWAWFFQTTTQDRALPIGFNCTNNDESLANAGGQRVTYIEYQQRTTCPGVKVGGNEGRQLATITRPALQGTNNLVLTVPHPRTDGWWGEVAIDITPRPNGSLGGPSNTRLTCAGGAPTCLDYELLVARYEGYSGFAELQDWRDYFDGDGNTIPDGPWGFSISGDTLTATIPYAPKVLGVDGDLMIDDLTVFPWPYGEPGARLSALVGETVGTLSVGSPWPICPDSDDISPEDPVTPPIDPDPTAPGGNGDCIRGIFGLLTLLDWGPDAGFHLRAFPRSPAYAPSPSSLSCRYPIGHFPAPPAPVTVEDLGIGPQDPIAVNTSTSPFDRPFKVGLFSETAANSPNGAPVAGTPTVDGVPLPPGLGTIDPGLPIGRNQACNYTYVEYGLHYVDTRWFAPIAM